MIEELKEVSVINKTGSDNWKKMWAAAVKFAQESTLESSNTIIADGKCILCQQDISDSADKRIAEFYKYMTSTAIKESEKAHSTFEATVEKLKNIYSSINIEQIESVLRSSGVEDDNVLQIISQYKTVKSRCKWLLEYTDDTRTTIPEPTEIKVLQEAKDKILTDYTARIKSLQDIITNRDKQILKVYNLLAIKWINENKLIRKKDIQIKSAISSCKTNALTTVKKELTQILITNTYISRFEDEMRAMDCNHKIKVELVSKAEKGRAYHQVALRGAVQKKKTGDILSEGEFRVVSLAAFLADLSSWNKILPFIFDDPITSLDHKYEEVVAKRLVKLSHERQVIVFTHRLAFAQLLFSCNESYNSAHFNEEGYEAIKVNQVELRRLPLGEPQEPSYHGAKQMKEALKCLKNSEILLLKRQFKNQEYESYNDGIKALCSKLRIIVEHGIETDLLQSIVTRFGYSVGSLKVRLLYNIKENDIAVFEQMMTKYSAYEHSQSLERPVDLPELSDIEADIESLLSWCKDFWSRCSSNSQKK